MSSDNKSEYSYLLNTVEEDNKVYLDDSESHSEYSNLSTSIALPPYIWVEVHIPINFWSISHNWGEEPSEITYTREFCSLACANKYIDSDLDSKFDLVKIVTNVVSVVPVGCYTCCRIGGAGVQQESTPAAVSPPINVARHGGS